MNRKAEIERNTNETSIRLEITLDGAIVLLRKTILREKKVKGLESAHPGLFRTLTIELSGAAEPNTSNFTFALMMTCIGIVIILCTIIAVIF